MDDKILFNMLKKYEELYIIIDDDVLNPNEKLVISYRKIDKKLKDIFAGDRKNVTRYNREKVIRFVMFKELGINSNWTKYLLNNSAKIEDNIFRPCFIDAVWIMYVYVNSFCDKNYWLYNNVIEIIRSEYKINSFDDIYQTLNEYLRIKNIKFMPLKFNNYDTINCLNNRMFEKGYFKIKLIYKNVINVFITKIIRAQIILYQFFTREKYINKIEEDYNKHDLVILNKKGTSASGCVFAITNDNEQKMFVKGNESPLYNSIKNEIQIQYILKASECRTDKFLYMKEHDKNLKWIAFPYVNNQTLREYIKLKNLDKVELDMFGDFLLEVLNNLNNTKVIHRDLRLENIMVIKNWYGSIEKFMLFDFGFSVYANNDQWRTKKVWDKRLIKIVGGKNRYNDYIVDDAAAAYCMYIDLGGEVDSFYANTLKSHIGNIYLV